jgi:hypothetical protein
MELPELMTVLPELMMLPPLRALMKRVLMLLVTKGLVRQRRYRARPMRTRSASPISGAATNAVSVFSKPSKSLKLLSQHIWSSAGLLLRPKSEMHNPASISQPPVARQVTRRVCVLLAAQLHVLHAPVDQPRTVGGVPQMLPV